MIKPVNRPMRIKMLGRVLLLVVVLALAWGVADSQGDAQQTATVRVVGPASPVSVGQPFNVTIEISNAENLGAFEFEYNFSPSVAATTVENIQLGSFLGSTGRTTGALRLASAPGRPGVPLFGAYSYGTANGPNGSGVVATVAMTAVAPGASQLSLTQLKLTTITGGEVAAISSAGNVTVTGTRLIYLPLLRRNSGN